MKDLEGDSTTRRLRQPFGSVRRRREKGLSLVELTLVIAILLALSTIGIVSYQNLSTWRKGKSAGIELRSVYAAQRLYLADHPTSSPDAMETSILLPYLPNGNALPDVDSLDGIPLTIRITSIPPVFLSGDAVYDPSGSPNDGLWDVGNQ